MNLLHYLPYLLAFMAITAVLYAWGLYRAQTAARDDASLLKAKGVARIRRAVKKQGGCTRAQLREAVRDLSAGRSFSRRRIAVTDPDAFLQEVLGYMVDQRILSVKQTRGEDVYTLRN